MKKIISTLLLAAMILTFAACGETPEVIETQQPTQTAEPTEEIIISTEEPEIPEEPEFQLPICEEVTELSMLFQWDQTLAGNYVSSSEDFEGFKWLETQTNVHIAFIEVASGAWTEQFNLTIASQEYPDLFNRAAKTYSAGVQHGIEEDIFLDVTDLLDEYAPNYKAAVESNSALKKNLYTEEGRMAVFYPIYTRANPGPNQGLAVRQDWLDELNLEVPVTYDDYEEVMEAFKVNYDVEMGIMMSQYGVLPTNAIASGFDLFAVAEKHTHPFYVVDGQVKLGRVGQNYYEYLSLMHDWYEKGYITPDFVSWTSVDSMGRNPYYLPSITTGKTGIFNLNTSSVKNLPSQCEDPNAVFTMITEPVKNEGDVITVGKANFDVMYEGTGVAISTQCENWEIAMKWLDWFYTEEGAVFNMCGLEGITWNYDENGEVWWTDMYLNPEEGLTAGNILYKYAVGTITWGLSMKNEMDYRKYEKLDDVTYAARLVWGSIVTYENTYPDGATMNSEEGSEFSLRYGDLQTYLLEVTPKFITGEKPLSEYAEYEKMVLETLHGQEMIDLKQQAYDRYMTK